MKYCPNCCTKIVSSGKFCSECGAKLSERGEFCLECGVKLVVSGNFCIDCGAKMPPKDVTTPEIAVTKKVLPSERFQPQVQHITTPKIIERIEQKEVGFPPKILESKVNEIKNNIKLMLKALDQNDPNLAKEYHKRALEIDNESTQREISKHQIKIAEYFKNFTKAELDFFKAMLEEWKKPKYPYLPDSDWKLKMQISYTKTNSAVIDWITFDSKNAEAYYTAGLIEKIYSEMRTDYYSHDRKNWFAIDKRARAFFNKALEINPNFEQAKKFNEEKKKSRCFIATAAYGTPFTHEIDILRNFRDSTLERRKIGELFVKTYYKISPPIAAFIDKSEKSKLFVRKFLNLVVNFLKRENFTFEDLI